MGMGVRTGVGAGVVGGRVGLFQQNLVVLALLALMLLLNLLLLLLLTLLLLLSYCRASPPSASARRRLRLESVLGPVAVPAEATESGHPRTTDWRRLTVTGDLGKGSGVASFRGGPTEREEEREERV